MKHFDVYFLKLRLWFNLSPQQKILGICGFALLLSILAQLSFRSEEGSPSSSAPEAIASVDTYIPVGHVLVPIQVSNYESLDSILGSTGVVDLFIPALTPGQNPKKAASRIKILRAPNNPSQFAVLAPDEIAQNLVTSGSGYYVVVQNPKSQGTKIERAQISETSHRASSRIEIEDDDDK